MNLDIPKLNITLDGRQLKRSRKDKWFMGVCGGVAEHYGMSAGMVRLITAVLTLAVPGISTSFFIILYIALGLMIPEDDE